MNNNNNNNNRQNPRGSGRPNRGGGSPQPPPQGGGRAQQPRGGQQPIYGQPYSRQQPGGYPNQNYAPPQDQSGYGQQRFSVHISDEDYENEGASEQRAKGRSQNGQYQRLAQQKSQPDQHSLARRDVPVSRTRIITSASGEKYEIPEENNLPPTLMRKQRKNQKSRGCVISIVYALIVCSISALLAFYMIVGINDMFGLVKEQMEIVVTIPPDATLEQVTKILDENGVVDYPFFFKLYANFTMDDDFKHGEFTLNKKSDYDMIIRKLTRPSTADKSVVKVTIPEGLTLEQVAEILDYNCVCEKEPFFETIATHEFKHKFYKSIPIDEEKRVYKLEGYLFPDTYSFYIWEGSKSAINRMLNAFDDKVYQNKELEFVAKAKDRGLTTDQIIILASIIERETGDPEQMKNVASVFYNRMRNKSYEGIGGKLQSDATRWYPYATKKAMEESTTLTDEQKANWVSAYDTTTFAGLPPGPICCPSLNAIKAALNPNGTSYYYFFTAEDSEGKMQYYYAATYDEHRKNVANYG